MSKKLLITFGCSWTYGVGSVWHPNIAKQTYMSFAWNPEMCFKYSFRNLLCEEFDLENKNFSEGGSSNQRQFRYAKEYLGSEDFKRDLDAYEQIIVLHGITDTGRNEFYSTNLKQLVNLQYAMKPDKKDMFTEFKDECTRFMVKNAYDHDNELNQLLTEFRFYNNFYKAYNIKNIWIDTFNHHEYKCVVPNLLGNESSKRDLMSQLAIVNGIENIDERYHASVWKIDSDRVGFLVDKKILNPISMHPTQEGHKQIFEILKDYFIKNNIVV